MPLEFQNFSWLVALLIFAGAGGIVVVLGWLSLRSLGRAHQWTAISIRLIVVALLIMILGNARWEQKHDSLEVMLLNDASASVDLVSEFPGRGKDIGTVRQALDRYYRSLTQDDPTKERKDRVGMISFRHYARVDAMPNTELRLDARGTWAGRPDSGTDIGAGIQLALATMSPDAMHRLVLVSDGNQTMGDALSAADAAKAQNVPIDVVMLRYDVKNDVMIEQLVAPEWKRENEPFDLLVRLRSTNAVPVSGSLRVKHVTADGEADVDMDATTQAMDVVRRVTLQPGSNAQFVRVPPQTASGVHRFKAIFTPDDPTAAGSINTGAVDAIGGNDSAEAFTFVNGEGKILFVDGTMQPGSSKAFGDALFDTLHKELVAKGRPGAAPPAPGQILPPYEPIRRIGVGEFPSDLPTLQSYNAVILYNVPLGGSAESGVVAGLNREQDGLLATYVHDMGGGLLMVGGDATFGAGGWTSSETEKILPVDMEIPAQRNVGKGALVLIMHSCEMPQGNYWGEQCAIEAVKTLSVRDEVGIISYGMGMNNAQGIGGAQWDRPLDVVKNKVDVIDKIKKMQLGDMPSFDDAVNLAVNGTATTKGLKNSNARHKHIIVISDGDPTAPMPTLITACVNNKISISTVTVYPHIPGSSRPPSMESMAKDTKGKAYGPIETDPKQLPQIFIKEAQVVKRSLIQEEPLELKFEPGDPIISVLGARSLPGIYGMVLTSRKNDPKVMVPVTAGKMNDPVLAYWQSGLGRSAVWTSDAHNKWAAEWMATPHYGRLFMRMIEEIQRPMQAAEFQVRTKIDGDRGEILVEALDKDAAYRSFLTMSANVIGGEDLKKPQQIRLVQVGPGQYRGTFRANEPGAYVAAVNWSRGGEGGILRTGQVKNSSPESQALRSNEVLLRQIADRTGGRVLQPFVPAGSNIFSRDGVTQGYSPKEIWDTLLPWLLALIILDVAARRIAWDWHSIQKASASVAARVRAFTMLRKVEAKPTLDALRKVREEVAETRFKQGEAEQAGAGKPPPLPTAGGAKPDPKAKFVAPTRAVEGDITQVVGGATNKPIPSAPKNVQPKGAPAGPGGHLGGLMAAKKRAQQQIKEKEQEGQ